jgi:two-component system cell cycle response regulator DivK
MKTDELADVKNSRAPENFTCRYKVTLQGISSPVAVRMVTLGKTISSPKLSRWLASLVLLPVVMRNTAKKVLIVDDNDACRESLGVFIKGLGYEVFEATTGLEAIDRACSIHPDLIMMDLRLPGMNGDEATARLKRNASTRHIPVVINTSWTTTCNVGDRADRALDAGAEEILYKPFHSPMLRDVLRTYLLA